MVKTLKNALRKKRAKFAIPHSPPPTRLLLQFSDFTYLGAFDLPTSVGGQSSSGQFGGIALRTVAGQTRLFAKTTAVGLGPNQFPYEMTIPALLTSSPYNTASVVTNWGDVYNNHVILYFDGDWIPRVSYNTPSIGSVTYGMHWDETDGRLYWGYIDNYSPQTAVDDPSMGFSTLDNPAGPVSSAYGPWRFALPKQAGGGVTGISGWYAALYLGGKRLMAGFGGYFSIFDTGHGGEGPSGFAFDPPTATSYTPTTTSPTDPFSPVLSTVTLLSFGNSGTSVGLRSKDYENRQPVIGLSSTTANSHSGNVISATSNTLVVFAPPQVAVNALSGWRIQVAKAGVRQTKTILTNTANASQGDYANITLTTESNWSVTPDSTYTFVAYKAGAYGTVATIPSATSQTVVGFDQRVWGASIPGSMGQTDGYYDGATMYLVGGTGSGQSKAITTYLWKTDGLTVPIVQVPGSGYSVAPTVSFSGGGGSGAAALATVSGGAVTGVVMTAFGSGYSGQADIVFTPVSGGSGAVGVVLASGYGLFNFGTSWGTPPDNTTLFCVDAPRYAGVTASATSGTIVLDAFADPVSNHWNGGIGTCYVKMLTGAAAGEEHIIANYVASTKTVTLGAGYSAGALNIGSTWSVTPSAGDEYMIRIIGMSNLPDFPGDSRGYQTYQDMYFGAGIWIDTGTKHGLFYLPCRGTGQVFYQSSNILMDSYKHTLQCFDPMQLPPVTAGAQPDAAWEEDIQFPDLSYPLIRHNGPSGNYCNNLPPLFQGTPDNAIGGMAYDPVTSRLYIMMWAMLPFGTEFTPRVFVYHIG